MAETLLTILGITVGLLVALLITRRFARKAPTDSVHSQTIFERVSSVGELCGLEVHAKEIATSTKGWSWLPPLVLSQAKVAMIFQFEKRYFVDLTKLRKSDVECHGEGRFRVSMPPIDGKLRLIDLTPYDVAAGRVLGLFDVIQVNAQTQQQLIEQAQRQASALYDESDGKYVAQAQRSVESQVRALLGLFDVEVEFAWPESARRPDIRVERGVNAALSGIDSAAA